MIGALWGGEGGGRDRVGSWCGRSIEHEQVGERVGSVYDTFEG